MMNRDSTLESDTLPSFNQGLEIGKSSYQKIDM